MTETIITLILACSIPSAITGIVVRRFEKSINAKEKSRDTYNTLMVQGIIASISLGEASAIAVKNGKANGETEAALKYAKDAKHDMQNFLYERGVKKI